MRAVFLDTDTFGDFELLAPLDLLPLKWEYHPKTSQAEALQRIAEANVIVTNKVVLDAELLSSTKARYIVISATGTNNVDLECAKRLGILVSNVPSYSTASVAQLTFTFILMLSESLGFYLKDVKEGRWQKSSLFTFLDYPFEELQGKKLGIIGYGAIGKELSKKAEAFGMKVLICQSFNRPKSADRVDLEELLQESDFVSLHVPLTEKTKGLIGEKELYKMKKTSYLINVSRGSIVDEKALVKALEEKWIRGAAIDVLSKEPPSSDNPLLHYQEPNLILTPHIAWASVEARRRAIKIVQENISSFLQKRPQNLVV